MTLANLLNAETGVVALHEGQFRHEEQAGDQVLPFLTLQNFHTYCHPEEAVAILAKCRAGMAEKRLQMNADLLGDIAYNYAPFTSAIREVFPHARLLFIHRDGRDFVRSAYTDEVPDPTPVGWADLARKLTPVERFIALGRLRPLSDDPLVDQWPSMTPVERNAWLWAETNRLILEGLETWPEECIMQIRFEDFVTAPMKVYADIRAFLGIEDAMPAATQQILRYPINRRQRTVLPHWHDWDHETTNAFWRHAANMMDRLGYA